MVYFEQYTPALNLLYFHASKQKIEVKQGISKLTDNVKDNTYIAITGSTSQGSGTSRFMVRVLDNGMLAKNAFGPFIEVSVLLKSSCKSNKNLRNQTSNLIWSYPRAKSVRYTIVGITYL